MSLNLNLRLKRVKEKKIWLCVPCGLSFHKHVDTYAASFIDASEASHCFINTLLHTNLSTDHVVTDPR